MGDAQHLQDSFHTEVEVGLGLVRFVQEIPVGHLVFVNLTLCGLRLQLHARHVIEHGHVPGQYKKGPFHLQYEV